ncbi:hypothetical protein [Paenarthrobacter sp. NEAU-H11]|uniref:hypothetical protein n=1 Tax=Paenarthrobacter sp. NEAU-H11 TaxID=3423924 RepID=UPI003D330113
MSDSRQAAVVFIEAARHVENMVKLQQTESRALRVDKLITATFNAIIRLESAWSRFQVSGDARAIEAGKKLMLATLVLNIPDVNPRAAAKYLSEYTVAHYEFMNVLRTNAGLPEVDVPKYTPLTREDFMKQHGDMMESYGRALMERFGSREQAAKSPEDEDKKGENQTEPADKEQDS